MTITFWFLITVTRNSSSDFVLILNQSRYDIVLGHAILVIISVRYLLTCMDILMSLTYFILVKLEYTQVISAQYRRVGHYTVVDWVWWQTNDSLNGKPDCWTRSNVTDLLFLEDPVSNCYTPISPVQMHASSLKSSTILLFALESDVVYI